MLWAQDNISLLLTICSLFGYCHLAEINCSEINCSKEVAIKQESSSFMIATKLELACREDPVFKGR